MRRRVSHFKQKQKHYDFNTITTNTINVVMTSKKLNECVTYTLSMNYNTITTKLNFILTRNSQYECNNTFNVFH